jgi:hypothetical protein
MRHYIACKITPHSVLLETDITTTAINRPRPNQIAQLTVVCALCCHICRNAGAPPQHKFTTSARPTAVTRLLTYNTTVLMLL